MWVSRKEFNDLEAKLACITEGLVFAQDEAFQARKSATEAHDKVDTLTKQMECSCENHEVMARCRDLSWVWDGFGIDTVGYSVEYSKVCLDCGWTTTYDTEEEALADKQELLDRQIDNLKEQKKALKNG